MFRMCKNTFNILLSLIKQNPSFTTAWSNGIQPISPAQKALVTLFYLSSQQTVRQIGDKFNIADSSVIKSRNDFLKSISTLRNKLIKWPTTEEEQCIVSQQFESLANFKGNTYNLPNHLSVQQNNFFFEIYPHGYIMTGVLLYIH